MINEERLKLAVAEIRQRLKLSTVLKREGALHVPYKGLMTCIFHADSRPSLSIDDDKGVFYCFSCGRKGNVIKLVQECESVLHNRKRSFAETVDFLIKTDSELEEAIGFETVFQEDTKEYKLPRTETGAIVWSFTRPKKPKIVDTMTIQSLCRTVRRKFKDDGDADKVMRFIGACQKGLPLDIISESYNGTNYIDSSIMTDVSDDVINDFTFLFQ